MWERSNSVHTENRSAFAIAVDGLAVLEPATTLTAFDGRGTCAASREEGGRDLEKLHGEEDSRTQSKGGARRRSAEKRELRGSARLLYSFFSFAPAAEDLSRIP